MRGPIIAGLCSRLVFAPEYQENSSSVGELREFCSIGATGCVSRRKHQKLCPGVGSFTGAWLSS